VVGVHTPEFAFERDPANVTRAVRDLDVPYPVVLDNSFLIWRAFANRFWPTHYFIDTAGRIRYQHAGEGEYERSEQVIQQLLRESGATDVPAGLVKPNAPAAQAAAGEDPDRSPETYVGADRAASFASGAIQRGVAADYTLPDTLARNGWGLGGRWTFYSERAVLATAPGRIRFRFHARDLHLVLNAPPGKTIRFRVTLDGAPVGDARGADLAPDGTGTVTAQRLYQLIRQNGPVRERVFEIEFLDPGVEAYAFTFG